MQNLDDNNLDATSLRIGVVVSRYHREITDGLLNGAIEAFRQAGGDERDLTVVCAPGAWELPAICRAMAINRDSAQGGPDAVVALGCVLTGETTHDQHIAQGVVQGLMAITCQTGMPIALGVLTCQSVEQAIARAMFPLSSASGSNKGVEAMRAAIWAANVVRNLELAARSPQRT
jgi:6,7-dimethyl-8-ribityllumazine synthase